MYAQTFASEVVAFTLMLTNSSLPPLRPDEICGFASKGYNYYISLALVRGTRNKRAKYKTCQKNKAGNL
jgi:hypothetical protein